MTRKCHKFTFKYTHVSTHMCALAYMYLNEVTAHGMIMLLPRATAYVSNKNPRNGNRRKSLLELVSQRNPWNFQKYYRPLSLPLFAPQNFKVRLWLATLHALDTELGEMDLELTWKSLPWGLPLSTQRCYKHCQQRKTIIIFTQH